MGRAKPLNVGGVSFHTQGEAYSFFSDMLARYDDYETVSEEEGALLYELLLRHPNASEKLQGGIQRFLKAPAEPKGSSFHLEDKEGLLVDFSYKLCVRGQSPTLRSRFSAACAAAISQAMLAEKQRLFDLYKNAEGEVLCAITLQPTVFLDSQLRHTNPSFDTIVETFIEDQGLKLVENLLAHSERLQYGNRLASEDMASEFRKHHQATSALILTHKSAPRS